MSQLPHIKVMGERNSGTNYLDQLLALNFDCKLLPGSPHRRVPLKRFELSHDLYFRFTKQSNLGWKHSMAPDQKLIDRFRYLDQLLIIFMVKNPYSFILSLYKRPYQYIGEKKDSLEEFLKTDWRTTGRENWSRDRFENPVELWNLKTQSYLRFTNRNKGHSMLLRYEDLISEPREALLKVSKRIRQDLLEFKNIQRSTKEDKGKDFDYYRQYYLAEKWREDLSAAQIEIINSALDPNLVKELGYRILDPDEKESNS